MADRTARSIHRARVESDHRPQLKLVAGAREGAPDGEAARLVAPATAPPVLSQSSDICGIGRGGWAAAALFYAGLATALLVAAWQATPPEPWPPSPSVFKVVFEPAPPAPIPPAAAPEPPSAAPEARPAPTLAQPEPDPARAPPLAVAEPTPQTLPKPPPAKPAPPRQRAAPPPSAAPAPTAPTEQQVATAAVAPPALPSTPVLPPQPISGLASNRKPDYPLAARLGGQQGLVVLRVEVSPAGTPLGVKVVSTSGYSLLDKAALAAVEQWRFHPATQAGMPVVGIRDLPINFRLEE